MSQPLGVVLAVQHQFRHAKDIADLLDTDTQTILNALSNAGLRLVLDENGIAEDAKAIYPFVKDVANEPDWNEMYKFLEEEE